MPSTCDHLLGFEDHEGDRAELLYASNLEAELKECERYRDANLPYYVERGAVAFVAKRKALTKWQLLTEMKDELFRFCPYCGESTAAWLQDAWPKRR